MHRQSTFQQHKHKRVTLVTSKTTPQKTPHNSSFFTHRVNAQVQQPLVPLVDEFAARLFSELDYVQEGRNCERFAQLYANVPRVRTPTIKWEATSRRVITMQWIGACVQD